MSTGDKRPYAEMLVVAQALLEKIVPYCQRPPQIAGSLRRQRELAADIEIVAVPQLGQDLFGQQNPQDNLLVNYLTGWVERIKGGREGEESRYMQFRYAGHTVDLFMPEAAAWGCIFAIRTGSSEFSQWLVTEAASRAGLKFSDGRLLRRHDSVVLETPEEADVFAALGLPFLPPALRDDLVWLGCLDQTWTGEETTAQIYLDLLLKPGVDRVVSLPFAHRLSYTRHAAVRSITFSRRGAFPTGADLDRLLDSLKAWLSAHERPWRDMWYEPYVPAGDDGSHVITWSDGLSP